MDKFMRLHHLTSHRNIDSIRKKGLVPKCGGNQIGVGDFTTNVFFCTEEEVPIWGAMLYGIDTDITVDVPSDLVMARCFDGYDEYCVDCVIPSENIVSIKKYKPMTSKHVSEIMVDFVEEMILDNAADYYLDYCHGRSKDNRKARYNMQFLRNVGTDFTKYLLPDDLRICAEIPIEDRIKKIRKAAADDPIKASGKEARMFADYLERAFGLQEVTKEKI